MDDFERDVWCLCGLPVDAINTSAAVAHVRSAALDDRRCFISTPNLNFLIASQADEVFRRSVILSDLSLADGMPLLWLAKLGGVPLPERVAGSSMFEQLRSAVPGSAKRLSVFFFGGEAGAAERACQKLTADSIGLTGCGWHEPGFGSVDSMSSAEVIRKINDSGADFLVVALGARKGQEWIVRNLDALQVPVVSHLGAVINFVGGSVARAPHWVQRLGMEWLWRIKEEPALWRRYFYDGISLLRLLLSRALPHAVARRLTTEPAGPELSWSESVAGDLHTVALQGAATLPSLEKVRALFRQLALEKREIRLDLAAVTALDAAFLGQVLVLLKHQLRAQKSLVLVNPRPSVRREIRCCGAEYLLGPH